MIATLSRALLGAPALTTAPTPSTGTNPCSCPPYQPPGPAAAANCNPGPLPAGFRRGQVPVAVSTCADDTITQVGRTNAIWLPEYMFWAHLAKAATYSPSTPLSASGTKAAGDLALTVQLAAAASATAQGGKYLLPGMVLEIATSQSVPPGVTDVSIAGTFEDGTDYTQTMQFSVGHIGLSRFLVFFTRQVQGASYPGLVEVSRDYILAQPGTAIPNTAAAAPNDATEIVPTNGIRAIERDFTVTVTGANTDTQFRVELLNPVSRFWDWAETLFSNANYGGQIQ